MTAPFVPNEVADPRLIENPAFPLETPGYAFRPGRMASAIEPTDGRILIVDDEPANVALLRQVLAKNGYRNLLTLSDPSGVIDLIKDWDRGATLYLPDPATLDWAAVAIAVAGAVALFRYHRPILHVVVGAAFVGLVLAVI